jgi:hypothetical protein
MHCFVQSLCSGAVLASLRGMVCKIIQDCDVCYACRMDYSFNR